MEVPAPPRRTDEPALNGRPAPVLRGPVGAGRDRVLREARALFVDRGYAEVSMQQIADAAGLRKASIYHHFRDKEELFAQVVLREMERLRRSMEQAIARADTFRAQLEAVARLWFEQFESDAAGMIRDFRGHVPEERHGDVHCELERLAATLQDVFERARAAGETRDVDPRVTALLFFHMVASWAFHALEDPTIRPPSPEAAARTVTDLLLHGIATPAAPAPRPTSATTE